MGTRLYVGNLPFSADENQIRDLFAQGGRTVSEVKLVTDRDTGRPRGFGFVEMGSNEDADSAIRDLNGFDFGGRALTVNEARERTGGGGGGGFGGGGGGGRGRGGNRRF
jgi:cold-inducible RNA-binding protein